MSESKENCWDFKRCGKEQSCKAYPDNGRICFSVSGTLCGGSVQGHFANKKEKCQQCDFYRTLDTGY